MIYKLLPLLVLVIFAETCYALPPNQDLFSDYNKQINSEADAKSINVYDAWANNIENLIRTKHKKGIIVEEAIETDQYISDGLGNITIKEGADVGTVINKTNTENSTIVINNNNSRH